MKKVFCTFIAIVMLLSLVSCGINPVAKYPIVNIVYNNGFKNYIPTRGVCDIGYSFNEHHIFTYNKNSTLEELSKEGSLLENVNIYDNNQDYYIINFWADKSWDKELRYDLHENGYIISLDTEQRWSFSKGQTVLTVADGYAYYLEGVEIRKMNLDDETDNTVVYTFPFKKNCQTIQWLQ